LEEEEDQEEADQEEEDQDQDQDTQDRRPVVVAHQDSTLGLPAADRCPKWTCCEERSSNS